MSTALQDILKHLESMPEDKLREINKEVMEATEGMTWIPTIGPQRDAYNSKADILLYGGEPGGGKSSLLLGLAFNKHRRSLLMRRQYTDLGHILDEAIKFHGSRNGFNGSPPPQLKLGEGRLIDFGAAAKVGDEEHWQGNPHDFIGIDEATQFAKSQILFLMGWLRCADDPNQRTRVVLATNPPLAPEGLWVTEMFAPWLDPKFENPAAPGELRYAIMDEEDNMVWLDGPEPVENYRGKVVDPKSYTYIPASLKDNPFLSSTNDYQRQLDALPHELHSILMSGFQSTFEDHPLQIIPTDWVRLAQERWRNNKPEGIPMCAMGVDCTGGGKDPIVIAPRYDGWFDNLIEIPGRDVPKNKVSSTTASHILVNRRDKCPVNLDVGGGYGLGTLEMLEDNDIEVNAFLGAEKSTRRSKDGKLKFTNNRTAALWMMREALDPEQPGGSPIMLPPSNKLLADLTAPTYKVTSSGVQAESKVDVCDRLKRSTNEGDAVCMAWFYGSKMETHALDLIDSQQRHRQRGQAPKVVLSRRPRTGRR